MTAAVAVRNLPFCIDPGHMGAKEAAEDTVANTSAAEQRVDYWQSKMAKYPAKAFAYFGVRSKNATAQADIKLPHNFVRRRFQARRLRLRCAAVMSGGHVGQARTQQGSSCTD